MSAIIKDIFTYCLGLMLAIALIGCEPEDDEPDLTYNWPTGTLAEADIDQAAFDEALTALDALDDIYSFIVIRNGLLVNESYWHNWTHTQRIHLRSITKSVVSAMVGVALQESFIDSVQEPLSNYLNLSSSYPSLIPDDKNGITIQNFLTMTSGIEWTENGAIQDEWFDSSDLFEFVLNLPMENTPGEVYEYNTAAVHVLSGVITLASGKILSAPRWLEDLAQTYLFEPLGIGGFSWNTALEGLNLGGFGLYMTPRDLARFGQLYLEDGIIDGKRIFPAGWAAESFMPRETNLGYGYLWWIKTLGSYSGYAAQGAAGQMLYLFPDYDMIIVFTAGMDSDAVTVLDDIVQNNIMPSINPD